MKAIRLHTYGGPAALVYEDAPKPEPGAGEILVRVHAAAVNPVDWKVCEGLTKGRLMHSLPLIPGWDLSGVVESTGPGTLRLKPGDEVYSRPDLIRDGAYSEYIVVRESEVALKPKSIDHIHAAGIPLAALTAWQALFDAANLAAGQTVLIHAGAGGVGNFAVQLARWKGARVIATASARNHEFVRSLGADQMIDYTTERFEDKVRDLDVVLDTMGGETRQRSWQVLKKDGFLVSVVSPPPLPEDAAAHGVRQTYVFVLPNPEQLTQMAALVDSGKLQSPVDTVFPLSQARQAQELNRAGHTRGKIILRVV